MDVAQAARTERAVQVHDRQIFVTEAGTGPKVLLHRGGADAAGASNYAPQHRRAARAFSVERTVPAIRAVNSEAER